MMNRNFLLYLAALLCSVGAYSQYYVVPVIEAGFNPGNLNTDAEQPPAFVAAEHPGYSDVLTPGATTWSGDQTLPFSFEFNGMTVTSFDVHPTGVVTFTANPTAMPVEANEALPSAMIPDNSVCAWGMNLLGANDGVVTKTFGDAPNRQQWVIWASASSSDLGAGWAYWGIVMEETTNNVYVVDMRNYSQGGQNTSMTVGLQFDNANAISAPNSPNIASWNNATGGSQSDALDNTWYMFSPGTQPAVDIVLIEADAPKFVTATQGGSVTGRVLSLGASNVSSYDVEWTDGSTSMTETFSVNLDAGDMHTFTHGDMVTLAAGANATVDVEAIAAGDADVSNNTASFDISGASFWPDRIVVGEEATGTWCGWCPRGHVWMEYMADNYPESWIGIAVHNSDPMVVSAYDTWIGGQIGGYPSGLINRAEEVDPSDFETFYNNYISDFGYADIEVEAIMEDDTRDLEVSISATFAASMSEDLRFAAVLIEDEVTGTGGDWDQVNYYSVSSQNLPLNGAGHDWQASPNPVPAAEMVYEDVARELMGGVDGATGSVPAMIAADDVVDYMFNANVSNDYNEAHLRVAVLLIDQATGEIVNASQTHITVKGELNGSDIYVAGGDTLVDYNGELVPIEDLTVWDGAFAPVGITVVDESVVNVFPNPANTTLNISGVNGLTNVKVFDMTGRLVMNVPTESGNVDVTNLTPGNYNLVIENGNIVANRRLSVVR